MSEFTHSYSVSESTVSHERAENEYGIQERHPDWPKIKATVYLAPHGNKADAEGSRAFIEDADVILYEDTTQSESTWEVLNDVAKGRYGINLDGVVSSLGEYNDVLVRTIHKTGKVLDSIDIGETSEEKEFDKKLRETYRQPLPKTLTYGASVEWARHRFTRIAKMQSDREEAMIRKFEPRMGYIFEDHKELVDKDEVNVLITLGSMHSRIIPLLKEMGVDVRMEHSGDSTYIYDYSWEVQRAFMRQKDVSDELIQRAMIDDIVLLSYYPLVDKGVPNDDVLTYAREVVKNLSEDDMRAIHSAYSNDIDVISVLNGILERNGHAHLATSHQEILEVISKNPHLRRAMARAAFIRS